jgi:pimeloyl-ACP methyl ester carboxylesterase
MPQVRLEHATIEYRVLGPDDSPHPPVLFVHGILVNHTLWTKVAEDLADKGFRCILPDWPLGSHTIPVDEGADLSPRGIAAMIRDLIVALDLSDVTLVGSDTGGGLCQFTVDAYPERIGRLVLTNCDAFDKFPPFPFDVAFTTLRGPRTIKALFGSMRSRAVRHSPLGFGLLIRDPDPAMTDAWLQPCRADSRICRDLATLLRHVAQTDLTDVATRLSQFTKPVTVVWGQADRCFTPSLGRRLAALFPNSTIIEVPDAKTFVALDDPDVVVGAIEKIGGHPASA